MREAESLPDMSATIADTTSRSSMPSASPAASSSLPTIIAFTVLPISIVVSLISSLLLLMRPAAHYVEGVAGLALTDIA